MGALVPLALVLVCPLVMGGVMLWMHGSLRGRGDE